MSTQISGFIVGREVSPNYFIGRDKEIKNILKLFLKKDFEKENLSISGLNRTGKTSLVNQAMYQLRQSNPNFDVIFLSLDKYNSFLDFAKALVKDISNIFKLKSILIPSEISDLSNKILEMKIMEYDIFKIKVNKLVDYKNNLIDTNNDWYKKKLLIKQTL